MTSVNVIINLYSAYGDTQYGEQLTQTEHAVPCAPRAQQAGVSDTLIVADLPRVIGHLLDAVALRRRDVSGQ